MINVLRLMSAAFTQRRSRRDARRKLIQHVLKAQQQREAQRAQEARLLENVDFELAHNLNKIRLYAEISHGFKIANVIRSELVCCDIYDRVQLAEAAARARGEQLWNVADHVSGYRGHEICHWGEAAARIAATAHDSGAMITNSDDID